MIHEGMMCVDKRNRIKPGLMCLICVDKQKLGINAKIVFDVCG